MTNFQREIAELLQYIPTFIGRLMRRKFYERTLAYVGRGVSFHVGSIVTDSRTKIGAGTRIGPNCTIGWASIGEDVLFAQNCHLLSGRHQHAETPQLSEVTVGSSCWIGASSIIAARIGSNVIIGAGSVVVSDIKDGAKAVGVPARVIDTLA